jgi:hypothetical protein
MSDVARPFDGKDKILGRFVAPTEKALRLLQGVEKEPFNSMVLNLRDANSNSRRWGNFSG